MAIADASPAARPPARVVCERLAGGVDPVLAARWLRGEPRPVALSGEWAGGATLLSSHPVRVAEPDEDPFALLDRAPFELDADVGAAEVGGGWFGWLGFGLARAVERIPPPPPRPESVPPFDLAFHDHVVRCDAEGNWWFEALWSPGRAPILSERLECWRRRLAATVAPARSFRSGTLRPAGAGLEGHRGAVAETVARIAAGEFSQANLCLRLEAQCEGDPLDLWVRAAAASRPAYAAYIGPGGAGQAVASLSPELFLRRVGREVETRPIKGTAPRSADPSGLLASAKDRAENVMIVDLMRNDLGRVCSYGSVRVLRLCAVRPAAGVWHLESSVSGRLRPGVGDAELLRAAFPPGSVTGAPKVQALKTIHELESTAREAYCGAIGVRSPLHGLELSVAIRTVEVARGRLWLGVGGGIVSDSSPSAEVQEALTKARGVAVAAGLEVPLPVDRAAGFRPAAGCGSRPAIARRSRPEPALGVFETIRVEHGRPVWLGDHLGRLSASCLTLNLPLPPAFELQVAAAVAGIRDGGVRVTVTGQGVDIALRERPAPAATRLEEIVLPGGLGAHKWVDRQLIDACCGPGLTPLICDIDGTVLEAGYAAVMLAIGDTILAPPLDGRVLPSISRQHTLAAARRGGRPTTIRPITLEDVRAADAIILTSSLRGPHPGVMQDDGSRPLAGAICAELARSLAR